MQERYLPLFSDGPKMPAEIPMVNAEVEVIPYGDLQLLVENQPSCGNWKNAFLAYKLVVQGPDSEILTHEGNLQTNFLPGMSTAICMTSNLQFDPDMTPEDVQRVTLAALIRDGRDATLGDGESEDLLDEVRARQQQISIFERRMEDLWSDMPELVDGAAYSTQSPWLPRRSVVNLSNQSSDMEVFYTPEATAELEDSNNLDDTSPLESQTRIQKLRSSRFWKEAKKKQFLTCVYCPRTSFKSLAQYVKHLDKNHHSQLVNNEHLCPSKTCVRSVVGFPTELERVQHVKLRHRSHNRLFELKCRKWFLKRQQLTRHASSIHVPRRLWGE
ncbi:hypothetical protein CKK34_2955 [Yarrowia sp. E02]|nr:hypothetical protein CKK34_2955 [Yarrowia sp. E02]